MSKTREPRATAFLTTTGTRIPINTPSVPGIDEELIEAEELCESDDNDEIEAIAINLQRNVWVYA